jgi:tetratricopeptide (TPR) repeat protein
MNIFLSLPTFALRQVIGGACEAVGFKPGGEVTNQVVGFLTERFTDRSQRLTTALQQANDKAWKALEIALAGDSLWDRCKAAVARAEDQAFAQQVRAFLDATPLPELAGKTAFRQKCLDELRAARKARTLTGDTLNPRQLARHTAEFARYGDPASLLEAEWRMAVSMTDEMKQAGYTSLAWLLSQRPRQGMPVLVVAVRYFFRRAVENDPKLFQGLAFAKLEALSEAQKKGFDSLSTALAQRGERLEELLADVKAVVVQTHSAVLDLQGQMKGHGEQIGQIGQAVMKLLEQHHLQRREVRAGDSLSIRNEGERQLVKQLIARYRLLPQGERQNVPALLNAIGKLEVVAGEFDQAQKDFQQVATMVDDTKAQAEAHFNAYQTALERRDLNDALKEFIETVKLDAKRYAPFPVGKYHPLRILGAGGFGTAYLCRHKYMDADVVVKALHLEAMGRDTDKVFTEAQVLRQLDHPAIIRISECGYVDAANKARPHIIMDYFQGQTLEAYVKEHGPLAVEDLLVVARQVAEGLQAAHGAKILHRDVKPANLLVRKEGTGWKVKIIDFGLAMPQKVVETSRKASKAMQKETMIGSSIAGTLDYGAPEQMGRRKEPVGPYSDVYGWAKTCCYALFQTTQPLLKHWSSCPVLWPSCWRSAWMKTPSSDRLVLRKFSRASMPGSPLLRLCWLSQSKGSISRGPNGR